jgi:DNA-binding beta-propeller fold protein YncE
MKATRVLLPAGLFTTALIALSAAQRQQAAQAPVFEVDALWPRPMANHWLLGSAVGVAVDARDHIFVVHLTDSFNQRTEIGLASNPPTGDCCRPAPNVLEFDADGNLAAQWGGPGAGYAWPAANHGIAIDPQGNIWIGGAGGQDTRLLKFSRDGRFLQEIGKAVTAPAPTAGAAAADTAYAGAGGRAGGRGGRGGRAGGPPPLPANSSSMESFGGAASISFDAATNEAYVADGYRNRRVVVIDTRTGAFKRMWGAYGEKPNDAPLPPYDPAAARARQFNTVTCAELSSDGLVYVCDRGNNRIQVFRKDGTFVKEQIVAPQTRGDGSVWDIAFSRDPQQRFLYVADGMNMKVHILDRQSLEPLTSFGAGGKQPGQFLRVHSVATDSKGNLYTTETNEGKRVQKFVFKGLAPVTDRNRGVLWPGRGGND